MGVEIILAIVTSSLGLLAKPLIDAIRLYFKSKDGQRKNPDATYQNFKFSLKDEFEKVLNHLEDNKAEQKKAELEGASTRIEALKKAQIAKLALILDSFKELEKKQVLAIEESHMDAENLQLTIKTSSESAETQEPLEMHH